ncbi:hypothetical protein L2E82_31221 [Cichorium intybus]|uniref:Uncharacterized protein n=1 Tax=Cichorium intybus TaxID=13427 RepID=A0ACB9D2X3_CICIN|nr:hypothetical protein L2E82_31221 [Cichorium intybus]
MMERASSISAKLLRQLQGYYRKALQKAYNSKEVGRIESRCLNRPYWLQVLFDDYERKLIVVVMGSIVVLLISDRNNGLKYALSVVPCLTNSCLRLVGVSNSGSLEATLARFSAFLDINIDIKDEILLFTRYIIKYYRRDEGHKRYGYHVKGADDFVRGANINEEQPLDGSLLEYMMLWTGKALTITTPNQQPLSIDQSSMSTSRIHFSPQQSGQDNVHAMHSREGTFLHKGTMHHPRKFLSKM